MAHADKLILVTGATGHQGGAVLRHLRAKGFPVRAFTRNPDSPAARALEQPGIEVVRGDLDDIPSINRALEGVYGVYSVQNWRDGAEVEIRHGINLAEAAGRAAVSQFVYSSVGSAEKNTGIPHFDSKFQVEQRVRTAGVPFTIFRPVFFMENFLGMREHGIDQGVLAWPLSPETHLQMIAVDDIGAFVALAFEHPGKWRNRTLDIAGDEHSVTGIARLLGSAVGREVKYQQVPWDEFEKNAGREMTVMFHWFEDVGYHIDLSAIRAERPNMLTFEHWLQTHWPKSAAAAR